MEGKSKNMAKMVDLKENGPQPKVGAQKVLAI